jgi:hypothetical protein
MADGIGHLSAGNTPIRMVALLSGAGTILGTVGVVFFSSAGVALAQWWPTVAMALACGAIFGIVGTRMNVGARLGPDGLVATYLLRRARNWSPLEVAWAYLHQQRTTLLGMAARDEALHLVTYDGTDVQLSLPARGARRERALGVLETVPAWLPRAYIGFASEAVRAWNSRDENPRGWEWLVANQESRRLAAARSLAGEGRSTSS